MDSLNRKSILTYNDWAQMELTGQSMIKQAESLLIQGDFLIAESKRMLKVFAKLRAIEHKAKKKIPQKK